MKDDLLPERMPPIEPEKITEAQRRALAEVSSGPRGQVKGGPFVAMARSPGLLSAAQKVGEYLRFHSALDKRVVEMATLMTARQWTAQYEWQAHYPLALAAGLGEHIAAAIAEGRRPTNMAKDEELVHDLLTELFTNKCVCDATYDQAVKAFGEPGVIDLVSVAAYYSLLAMVMNVARTAPLPDKEHPPLPRLPR